MAKVVYKNLDGKRPAASRAVGRKRVSNAEGGSKTVHTLDANSASFEEDLRYVFARNVAKARRENKRIVGSPDGVRVPRKR